MKLFLDACVLYPTVMREALLAAARAGFFTPVWSDRVLEEWHRAALRRDAVTGAQAEGEITLVRSAWPDASVTWAGSLEARLWLPDPNDIHVLAAAIASSADGIITENAKDFPRHILAEEGLSRNDPDTLLRGFADADPSRLSDALETVRARAESLSGEVWSFRRLFKKARMPRLAKALS